MTEEKSLIIAEKLDVAVLFSKNGMDKILNDIEIKAMAQVPDITTDQGRKDIASMAHKVARSKTLIDDLGKNRIADAKKIVDEVNGYRKQARDFLDNLKSRVRQPMDEWEAEQSKVKAEEDRKQKEKIDARMSELAQYGANLPFFDVAGWNDAKYEEVLNAAIEKYQTEQKRLADEEAARKAENERLEAIRKEQDIKAKQLIEADRLLKEATAKVEAEKKALEDAKRAEQERKDREAFEIKAKEEARFAAEKAAKDKIEREAREKAEAEERAKAEAARREALMPDKEKLQIWVSELCRINPPELVYGRAKEIAAGIMDGFGQVLASFNEEIEEL